MASAYTRNMTHAELCDDVKASLNSLIGIPSSIFPLPLDLPFIMLIYSPEDKVGCPEPYAWKFPRHLSLPDGPPPHRRMPKLVHKWKTEDLRAWKVALDRNEVELVSTSPKKARINSKVGEKKKKNSNRTVRSKSKNIKMERSKMAVEIDVDARFPRLEYEIVDLESEYIIFPF